MSKLKDLTGQRFGRLTVISRDEDYVAPSGKIPRWKCKCDCGRTITVLGSNLKSGSTKSCGCFHLESAQKTKNVKHGKCESRLYNIWVCMKQRCYNSKYPKYDYYGGRGITVCDEWKSSFEKFQDWALSHGYAEELTLDRIKNDGNYEPGNCRWATRSVQNSNRRKYTRRRRIE